ncbi:myosin regulatory light chain, putative [Ixodes scapularis]|uniref:Myosin regulatory light chain, putative n=1 Tax=Ixodes scapularis TaxID=6945 RepID=B7PAY0_IXOSC|nr:myosin regulatory light chain, putative [Ixodes scapularis]|eukprot:XP_002407407.1 myosin regulatory light chain, putative [Ixodes scapularis]
MARKRPEAGCVGGECRLASGEGRLPIQGAPRGGGGANPGPDPSVLLAEPSAAAVVAFLRSAAAVKMAFQMIDSNKDGFVDKNDLRATWDSLGRIIPENDLDGMIAEATGPINFTMFLTIFGERVSGTDPEDVIRNAFKTFDKSGTGKISQKDLKKSLMTWGDKFQEAEVDEVLKEAPVDRDGNIDIEGYVKLICGNTDDEE